MGLGLGYAVRLSLLGAALAAACGGSSKSSGSGSDTNEPSDGGESSPSSGGDSSSGGRSAAGGDAAGGAAAGGGADLSKAPPGERVFAEGQVLDVRFSVEDDALTQLEEYGNLEEFVPAEVSITGAGFDDFTAASVGLRHKGNWTLHHCWDDNGGVRDYTDECRKLSYKIKFDAHDAALRFDGLKRLNLHAATGDATKLREFLAYSTFRDFGVDAPRTAFARVSVNDEVLGIFIAVEELDGRYTKAHFPEGPDGNLYKEVWPSTALSESDFIGALQTNEGAHDVSDMLAFAQAVADTDAGDFVDSMKAWVDLEQVLRYVAVDRALKNWDGIMAFYDPARPHNCFWYHDDGDEGRFHLVPWDLDNTFWEFDPYMQPEQWATAPPVPDWNSKPLNCNPRSVWEAGGEVTIIPPRCDHFLNLLAETSWPRFVELGAELLAGPLSEAALDAKIAGRLADVSTLVAQDPTLEHAAWQSEVERFRAILERDRRDFQSFLDAGLIEEQESTPSEPPHDVDQLTADSGLHVGGVTNFEFASAPLADIPAKVFAYSDSMSSFVLDWNTAAPISGTADLRVDFTFRSQPGEFDEYVGVGIATPEPTVDVTGYSAVTLTLASDVARTLRFRLSSPTYSDTWGEIWSEFSVELAIGPDPTTFMVPFSSFQYPEWAKDAWTSGQGFTTTDGEARQLVLERFSGFEFTPIPLYDAANELATSPQPGYLSVDNIYFQ